MSPTADAVSAISARFPRTRGDEPGGKTRVIPLPQFSPHTRG